MRNLGLFHINVSKVIVFVGSAIITYGVTSSAILSSRWDTSYQYMFLGGSISAIGLIFMLIDSKDKVKP